MGLVVCLLGVDGIVVLVGIVLDVIEGFDAGLVGGVDHLADRGVSSADFALICGVGEVGLGNQGVNADVKIGQALHIAGFVAGITRQEFGARGTGFDQCVNKYSGNSADYSPLQKIQSWACVNALFC